MYIVGSALVASLAAPTENMLKVHVFPLLVKSFSDLCIISISVSICIS